MRRSVYDGNMEMIEETIAEIIELQIDFSGAAEGKPAEHVNQMTLQASGHEIFLSFFQVIPPLFLGKPEDIARLKENKPVRPEFVSRLVMSPHFARRILKVLQENLAQLEAEERKENVSDTGTTSPNVSE